MVGLKPEQHQSHLLECTQTLQFLQTSNTLSPFIFKAVFITNGHGFCALEAKHSSGIKGLELCGTPVVLLGGAPPSSLETCCRNNEQTAQWGSRRENNVLYSCSASKSGRISCQSLTRRLAQGSMLAFMLSR
jgi:hypothetical protein